MGIGGSFTGTFRERLTEIAARRGGALLIRRLDGTTHGITVSLSGEVDRRQYYANEDGCFSVPPDVAAAVLDPTRNQGREIAYELLDS